MESIYNIVIGRSYDMVIVVMERYCNNLSSTLKFHPEIDECVRFGLIKFDGIAGYFNDFLSQRLHANGFPR